MSAQGGGVLASSLSLRLGRVGDAERAREMSDFDSNPFADPDLNNPFKVSVVPSLPRRRQESLFVQTDKFLRAHRARPSAPLGRLDWGSGPPHSSWGSRPGPRGTGLRGVGGSERNLFSSASGPPSFSTSPTEERHALPPGVGPSARGLPALLSGAGRVGALGRWSCHLPGKLGWPGPARAAAEREGGWPSGGVVMGTRGGGAELCLE